MECDCRFIVWLVWLLSFSASLTSCKLLQHNVSTPASKLVDTDDLLLNTTDNLSERITDSSNNCSGLKILSGNFQPKYSAETSFIRKCCPHGQSYEVTEEDGRKCITSNGSDLNVSVLNATFYENCIEDNELGPPLNYIIDKPCNVDANNMDASILMPILGKPYGDLLYVLQNGSLLTVNDENEFYDVYTDYCLDINRTEGFLYAIVCTHESNFQNRVLKAEAYLYAVCLWVSVPCLCFTALLYIEIDELRDLHGKSLAFHCTCLAIAYLVLGIVQVQLKIAFILTYVIQYFLLSCICWLAALCFDICTKIVYIYVKKMSCSINTEDRYFISYAIASFGIPIVPVLLAYSHRMYGIPLYFIKGQHATVSETGDYFVLPAAILLFLCVCCLSFTFYSFGTRQPKSPKDDWTSEAIIEYEEFFKLKETTKSVGFLFGVMSICMVIEMITSHLNATMTETDSTLSPFAFFDILIALQGLFIFIIFICSKNSLRIIRRWWVNTGSLDVITELEALKKDQTDISN